MAIDRRANEVLVSAASAWEIATKYRKGRLAEAAPLVEDWSTFVRELGLVELPISSAHAVRSGLLPLANPDPFDRMIAAQAPIEDATAVSNEAAWDALGVVRLWN